MVISNHGMTFMDFMVRSFSTRLFVFAVLVFPAALLAITLVERSPPVRPADADSAVAIWDIDLKLAKELPRNFRTTDDPLETNKGEAVNNWPARSARLGQRRVYA
jgi:hypothetical protein